MNRAANICLLFEATKGINGMLTVSELRSYASQIGHKGEEEAAVLSHRTPGGHGRGVKVKVRKVRTPFSVQNVSIHSTNPIIQNKTLTVKGEARGTKIYLLVVTFYNVDYSRERDGSHPLFVRPKLGEPFFMSPLSEGQNPVQVRCTCPWFRFAFAHWDKQSKALSGPAFAAYIRKTTTRPEVNPSHLPGICKHLISLFDKLHYDKVLY